MEALTMDVNWMAVGLGTVASFALGWLWYSPKLFVTKWAEGVGVNINDGSRPKMLSMVTQLIGIFLLAWVIGITASTDSLSLAILIALMTSALISANGLFAQKSRYAIATEAVYILAMVVVMILAHALV